MKSLDKASKMAGEARRVERLSQRNEAETSDGSVRLDATLGSRISAFVYGNILVVAAILVLSPADLASPKGVLYVFGTAISTYVAHVLSELVGHRASHRRHTTWSELQVEIRNGVPIASSAAIPMAVLALAWFGWLNPYHAWIAAQIFPLGRLALLGVVVARSLGLRPSPGLLLQGIGLATAVAFVAILKAWLTH